MSTDPREFEHPIDGSGEAIPSEAVEPTPEAIEAAAKAMDANFNPDKYPIMAAMFRDYAEVALTAAAPFIAAQAKAEALREAADDWRDMQRTDDHLLAQWLRARAATIEGKSE